MSMIAPLIGQPRSVATPATSKAPKKPKKINMPYYKQSSQQQEEQKLGMRKYAKYDRSFMLFGSAMNGLQGYITILENDSEKTENHKSKEEKANLLNHLLFYW